jgi:hypothetical protein
MSIRFGLKTRCDTLLVVASTSMRVMRSVLKLCALVPPGAYGAPNTFSDDSAEQGQRGCGPHHRGLCGSLYPSGLRAAQDRDRDLSPTLEGALCLLGGGDAWDVL